LKRLEFIRQSKTEMKNLKAGETINGRKDSNPQGIKG
jgi:hypothetical protein